MNFDELNEDNYLFFAIKHSDNPQAVTKEDFYDDLKRFKYLKRLLRRYEESEDLQERLILNHIIVLYNVFGIKAANKMMWFKIQPEYWHYIKPFLVFLNYLPEDEKVDVPLDPLIVERLRKI